MLRGAPWQVVIFSLGMYLVVYGLRNAGLTDHLAGLLDRTAQGGVWGAAFGTGIIAALLSSVMNNMPTVLVGALSIDATHATGAVKEAMIYANVIGCDLGPKITPIGSLATLLWLHVLGQKGIRIGWGYYFRVGATLTVPVLLVTLAALAIQDQRSDDSPDLHLARRLPRSPDALPSGHGFGMGKSPLWLAPGVVSLDPVRLAADPRGQRCRGTGLCRLWRHLHLRIACSGSGPSRACGPIAGTSVERRSV